MINKKYLKLIRSRKYLNDNSFIYEITSQRIIDSIDFFVRLITKIHRAILSAQTSTHKELKQHIQNLEIHLLAALKNLLPAKEKTDLTLLCDLLEYELCDNLNQWDKEILPALDRLSKKT